MTDPSRAESVGPPGTSGVGGVPAGQQRGGVDAENRPRARIASRHVGSTWHDGVRRGRAARHDGPARLAHGELRDAEGDGDHLEAHLQRQQVLHDPLARLHLVQKALVVGRQVDHNGRARLPRGADGVALQQQ
eukprot:883245-Prorocentrum_minimum.AAC.2